MRTGTSTRPRGASVGAIAAFGALVLLAAGPASAERYNTLTPENEAVRADAWTLDVTGRYSRLVGDAASSPIVENENQFIGGIGVSYKFGLR